MGDLEMKQYESEKEEMVYLKDRAKQMGMKVHPSIGIEKLREKVNGAITSEGPVTVDVPMPTKVAALTESISQRNTRLRKEANRLVRINITCMNPHLAKHKGDFASVSNGAIGTVKKFVPYNTGEPYHIPIVLLKVLQEKKFQQFYTTKIAGKEVKKSRMVSTFAIEVLPNLTKEELKTLADRQTATRSLEGE